MFIRHLNMFRIYESLNTLHGVPEKFPVEPTARIVRGRTAPDLS